VITARHGDRSDRPLPAAMQPAPTAGWTNIAASPLELRFGAATVSTGDSVIVWGGQSEGKSEWQPANGGNTTTVPADERLFADGAVYDVATDTWRMMSPSPLRGRVAAYAAWTGSEMLVFGGYGDGADLNDGALYNPTTDTWRMMAAMPASTCPVASTWTDSVLAVAGRCDGVVDDPHTPAASYDPAMNRWTRLPELPLASPEIYGAGTELLAMSGVHGGEAYAASTWDTTWRRVDMPAGVTNAIAEGATGTVVGGNFVLDWKSDPSGAINDTSTVPGLRPTEHVAWYSLDYHSWFDVTSAGATPTSARSTPSDTVLAWVGDGSISWLDVDTGKTGTIDRGSIRLDRQEASFVRIGPNRYFLWGGLLSYALQPGETGREGAIFTIGG